METCDLDIPLLGVSCKGKHLGHMDVKAGSGYSCPYVLERESTNALSLSAPILPLICNQVCIYSFNKHPWSNGQLCALLEPIDIDE